MLRVRGLKLPLEGDISQLKGLAAKKLKLKSENILKLTLFKKSLDARKKDNLHFVCTVDIELSCREEPILERFAREGVSRIAPYFYPVIKAKKPAMAPVIIGSGPCGLFAALILAEAGLCPLILERGEDADSRLKQVKRFWKEGILNPESNVQFGEGGAGTFSDGKLQSGIRDIRIGKLFEEMAACGAPEEILFINKPHIGTDNLHTMVKNLRRKIISLGGEFRFGAKLSDILLENKAVKGLKYIQGGTENELEAEKLVLAIGHSARDTFKMLYNKGIILKQKPFAVGLRIEHLQSFINKAQYGANACHPALGAADYRLSVRLPDATGVYTFCMCPGGQVVAAASEEGGLAVNGMSYFARKGVNANSAVLVGVNSKDLKSDHPLAGIEFQRGLETEAFRIGGGNYKAPVQLVGDFLKGRPSIALGEVYPSYLPGFVLGELSQCLPVTISESLRRGLLEMDRLLPGFAGFEAVLTGVESRSSSPVRIARGEDGQAIGVAGLYPAGEGAGYAGGITSSGVDGIRCAEKILASL